VQHLLLDELIGAKLHSAKDSHKLRQTTVRALIQQLEEFQSQINQLDVNDPESKREELFRNKRELKNQLDELRSEVSSGEKKLEESRERTISSILENAKVGRKC
jgi:DNA repair ATPase RecN